MRQAEIVTFVLITLNALQEKKKILMSYLEKEQKK